MSLGRDAILAYEDTNIGRVDVKEFGGEVCIALLTAEEADALSSLPKGVPQNVSVVILGACDERGKRLFKAGDAEALKKKPSKSLTTITNAILRHNGMLKEDAEEAKNASSETESDASASVSPLPSDEPLPS